MDGCLNAIILTYHSISEGRSPLRVTPSLFAEQMEWLSKNVRVMPLSAIVQALRQGTPLPEKSVALTFDDGFLDFYTVAAPTLGRLGLAATVFLPTAYCGRTNAWPGQPPWVAEQPLMTWEQVSQLADQGFDFGAHSVTHAALTELDPREAEGEVLTSKTDIESRTGRPVRHFSYPFGRWSPVVREAVRRHYEGGCSTGAGTVAADADPFALPRVDAHYVRSPAWFCSLFSARFRGYLAARRMIRRLRNQPEGSYAKI